MSKSIKIDELQGVIKDYLENYIEDIEEDVKETTDQLSKEAVKELKKESPRRKLDKKRKNPYYKVLSTKKQSKGRKYTMTLNNRTNNQLTHFLEYGHATRNGGQTEAIPHIKPIEEKYNKLYEEKIEKAIKRRPKS